MSNGQQNSRSQQGYEGYPFPLSAMFASAGDTPSGPASLPRSARTSFSGGGASGGLDGVDIDDIFDDYFYDDFNFNPSSVQQQSESVQEQRYSQGQEYSNGAGTLDQMQEKQQQQIYGGARGASQQVSWKGDGR